MAALEAEVRRGRRREEKLAAMQFRLREDVAAAGRDPAAFDRLRDVRGLEYELDFVTNRAQRTEQARAFSTSPSNYACNEPNPGFDLLSAQDAVFTVQL